MLTSRRGFLAGIGALIAAPAIVKATNIMPVKAYIIEPPKPVILADGNVFDRVNVRRLIHTVEDSIKSALQQQLFEPNDAFTRASVQANMQSYMAQLQARQAVHDFVVVCDDTNNTIQNIDSNQLVADIYIKPKHSIEYITLRGITTCNGVDFESLLAV